MNNHPLDPELIATIRKAINEAPIVSMFGEPEYGKSFLPLLAAIEACGWNLECHQHGIGGTALVLTKQV